MAANPVLSAICHVCRKCSRKFGAPRCAYGGPYVYRIADHRDPPSSVPPFADQRP